MNEQQPLGDIDIKGLLAAIDGKLAAGGKIGDLFIVSTNMEESRRDEVAGLERQRLNLLDNAFESSDFKRLLELDIRKAGETFKLNFERWKNARLNNPDMRQEDKELAEFMTLQNLAETAEREHERLARLLGATVPGSPEAQKLNADAFRWGKISTVVHEASEIKD